MLISEILSQQSKNAPSEIVTCRVSDNVNAAIAKMSENNVGAVVVAGDEGVAGIFTERDVLNGLNRKGAGFLDSPLQDSMVSKVIVVDPGKTVDEAIDLMREHRIRHLLVVNKDELVGVLSIRDLFARQLENVETTAEFLKQQVRIGSKPLPM